MDYNITKKRIKNFIIRIYPDKTIKVSVPFNATKIEIENFLKNKKDWIEKSLEKITEKSEGMSHNSIKLLGKIREKRLIKSEINMLRLSEKSAYIYHNSENPSKELIEKIIEEWKITQLNNLLKEYIEKYLKLLNTNIKYYKIKKMSSAWGIYHSREKYITFNILLIEKNEKCIEYVVLHELCHIFFQNHQKEFWNLVKKYMSDYEKYRKLLKQ